MKSMKRSAAMFARAAGTNVVFNVKSKDNVCKDNCFEEKNLCRVCSTRRKTKQTGIVLQTDFGVWLERRAKLEKSNAEEDTHCTHLMLI